ncbi:MAG: hypothetical protein IJQ85_00915 [Selenomonadaceae bacterium]|nr:hypothetical protein [Selenomonadaceae bacterium]
MNNSENGYAGAIFFALLSLGAILKINDIFGLFIGAGCALLSAISLRLALIKSAQAVEENHQRMEVQFQQLRSKIIETSEATIGAMNSVNDAAKLAQENLQVIRVRLAELDNLTQLAESVGEIKTTLAGFEENFFALNLTLEKECEKLRADDEPNKENLQTVVKLLQVLGQLGKKIDSSLDTLNEHAAVLGDLKSIDELRIEVENLNKRLDNYENLPLDANLALSRQDLAVLKRIASKI